MNVNHNNINASDFNIELDTFIEQLYKCEYIQDDRNVKALCDKAKEILSKEENVIYLSTPITVTYITHYIYIYNHNRYAVIFMVNSTT